MTENVAEKLDMEELSRSLTGFDEIAIQKRFEADFTELPGTLTARALLFIARKREGKADLDAYREVMAMRIDAVEECFQIPDDVREAAEGKAAARRGTRSTRRS